MNSKFKNKKAIIYSDCGKIKNCLLYEQVYEYRDLITQFILTYIKEPHQCVGLKMDHNIFIPSIILSLEHAFIFLPPEKTETQAIINQLKISWVLCFKQSEKSAPVVILNDQSLTLQSFNHNESKNYKDIYYIVSTSGTTGQTKCVKVNKHSIQSNINCLSKIFNIEESSVIYFGTPLTFDPSMIELLLALQNGACLLITTEKNKINPLHLYQTLFHPENGVDVLQIVPSLFLRWTQTQIESILLNERLKILAFGGECFPSCVTHYKKSSSLRIFNLYGITEVSCWATIFQLPEGRTDDVSLGEALEDTEVEIRDFSGNKVTEGEGEVFIGSKTRICLIDEESDENEIIFRATGDIAVINRGGIFYKGRKNDIFKRLGHKIQTSKIEQLVLQETGLENKCIWSKAQSKLLLFLIIDDFDENMKNKFLDKIRIKLLHSLPKQYFPDYIDIIRKCPITSHGKTNKKELELRFLNRSKPKETAREIFKTIICEKFGFTGNQLSDLQKSTFFEIGGNSILAIQILNEFKDETGSENPYLVAALFEESIEACLKCTTSIKIRKKRRDSPTPDSIIAIKKIKSGIELKIAWKYNLEACVDATPLIFEHKGRLLAAVGSFSHIFAVVDVQKGTEVAKFHLPDIIEATACLSPCQNFLYIGCFDGCLYCLDFIKNDKKWVYAATDRIKCKPALCQNFAAVVFGSYDKFIHCVNIVDGCLFWKTYVEESVISTPLVHKQKIYCATICGTCLCLSEIDGVILWRYKSGSPIFGTACIFNNVAVWPQVPGNLLCLTLEGGKNQEFKCGGHLYSSLVTWQDLLIFGCQDRNLYILEMEEDVLKIKLRVNLGDSLTTPCIYKGRVAVTGNSGHLFLVDFDGGLLGDLRLPGEVFSSVVATENTLCLGCRDNNFYCIKI